MHLDQLSSETNNGVTQASDVSSQNGSENVIDAFLEHHGVKGQKWGIRNRSRRVQVPSSAEHKKVAALRKKPVHALTNKQLKDLNARLSLEKTHRQLNPTKADIGKKKVKAIMGTAIGAATLYNLATGPAGKAAVNLGKKVVTKRVSG
jgi:hypothetical protein